MENSNDTTRLDISHEAAVNANQPAVETRMEDEVPTSTKVKIIAALAIVGIAGYIAYWVQEPVNLKADVLNSETTSETNSSDSSAMDSSATSTTVADATTTSTDATPTGASVSVDVSLYGFEPATLKIDKGTTVVWTNTSTADQTIIGSSTDGQSFASKVMTPGDTFSYKFDQDATFEYYSTFNPALKATLAVGLGSAESTTVADATTSTSTDTLFGSAPETDTTKSDTASTTSAPLETVTTTDTTTSTPVITTTSSSTTTKTTEDELKSAAADVTPARLSKTGPAEDLYAVALLTIAWFNRKKLAKVFNK